MARLFGVEVVGGRTPPRSLLRLDEMHVNYLLILTFFRRIWELHTYTLGAAKKDNLTGMDINDIVYLHK